MIRPAIALVVLQSIQALSAQCATTWDPGLGLPGAGGTVQATTLWDPDGAGPAAPLLVVGGTMNMAAATTVDYVATYDPASRTWAALGNPGYYVNALAVLPNGDLVAGGAFQQVVRWNGGAWVPLGGSHDGTVRALTVMPDGRLIAGGVFTSIGGIAASNIAAWNGTAWAPLGAGVSGGVSPDLGVYSLAVLTNGDLVAGGNFGAAGGLGAASIARWNGTAWSPLGAGLSGGVYGSFARALLPLPGGGLVAAGTFSVAGSVAVSSVATWNGTSWLPFGSLGDHVYALMRAANGAIFAAGSFASSLATWSGTAWTSIPGLANFPAILTMTELPGGDLALGGAFSAPFQGLVRWNGSTFSTPNAGISPSPQGLSVVAAVASLPAGGAVVGGVFSGIAGVAAENVARWDGAAWHALGSGTDSGVTAAVVLPDGDLVVGGGFAHAGGVAANNIARWNGTAWSPLGAGISGVVSGLCILPDGRLVAGWNYTVAGGDQAQLARWDGNAWTPLGPALFGRVLALAALPNGDVAAAGQLPAAGGATLLARWDGVAWSTIGTFTLPPNPFYTPVPFLSCLRTLANGDLLASGSFTMVGAVPAQNIARWNGAVWTSLGAGAPSSQALLELPDGDIMAGGTDSLGNGALARWDGSAWTSAGGGNRRTVWAVAMTTTGEIVTGGSLTVLRSLFNAFVATLASTCPASATAVGSGCTGAAGPLALAVTSLPWTGGRFAARSTGIPAGALAIAASGFGNLATPIVSLTPLGVAGCDLLVTLDAWTLLLPAGGAATAELAIPDAPVLAGLQFRHQHVVLELAPPAQITGITSTNALVVTVGTF